MRTLPGDGPVQLTIDGRAVTCEAGSTILAAARRAGIGIPTLCDDDRLVPSGACRLCLVEVEGLSKDVAACATPVVSGMAVRTTSPALETGRTAVLEWLAKDYPAAAAAADPLHPFHQLLATHGVTAGGPPDGSGAIDDSHPYIRVDLARCIDCYRCVRICDEVQGQDVWHVWDRGADTQVHPDGASLLSSACVACGACVDTCPTGALEDTAAIAFGRATTWTRTVCPYCGVGCELEYGTRDGRIVAAKPAVDALVNRGHACVKGRYAYAFVNAADRVMRPRLRRDREWHDAGWTEAIGVIAERLRDVIARYGPDAVGVLGSARATNEENYLVQKLARVVIGTNNVDCCARVCHAPSAAALKTMLGSGAATNSFDDIEQARTILVFGANPTENHPVVGARIRQAARHGARLIVVDPRRTELAAEPGTLHLAPKPGTNIPLLNALAHVILAEGLQDSEFIEERVDALAAFRAAVAEWTPERAEALCGVAARDIRTAARRYASGAPAMILHGLGVTEHQQGTDGVCGLINLALLTGNIGRRGAGVNPLRGQNNVQGAAHMGCDPGTLTGGVPLETGRNVFEAEWGQRLPMTPGLTLPAMMDAAIEGRLKALIVMGYDILLTNPNAAWTRRALESLDLLVVVDPFWTETAGLAHVFLPAQSTFEKDGTFMNAERRIQRVRAVVPPVGEARSDAAVVCDLATALGHREGFGFPDSEAVWNEIRRVWPGAAGISYARLEQGGLHWPCPSVDRPGAAVLYEDGFPMGRVALRSIAFQPTTETVEPLYPWVLTSGRTLYQFNAGTMTARTLNQQLRPADVLDISPADAAVIGVGDGAVVRVTSRYGDAVLPVHISSVLPPGVLFATFHTSAVSLNRLTSRVMDRLVGTPEYKVTAVRVEPV